MKMQNKPYVVRANIATCNICGEQKDIRCGACFSCSSFVNGAPVRPGVHKLWDRRNPANFWYEYETA